MGSPVAEDVRFMSLRNRESSETHKEFKAQRHAAATRPARGEVLENAVCRRLAVALPPGHHM